MEKFLPPYLCHQCKSISTEIESMLFVEQDSGRGFCSEECIEEFYAPLIAHYEGIEKSIRKDLNLNNEQAVNLIGHPKYMEQLILGPDEVWEMTNELGDCVYSFIKKVNDPGIGEFYKIILCTLFDDRPAFIFCATATQSIEYLSNFQTGEKVEIEVSRDTSLDELGPGAVNLEVDQAVLEKIDAKKSVFLAELLEKRSPADVPFENFTMYEGLIGPTLEDPDEVYSFEDDEGDEIFVYIKAHNRDNVAFYYFVLALPFHQNSEKGLQTLIPIICFPTLDVEVYKFYQKGKLITAPVKN